jgi:histidine triad (HIT) family protein|tara:strand:- start:457 stop:828 length:372 start_codon:yes stop_codon:yes gene_type:complete
VEVKLSDAERRPLSGSSYCIFCEIVAGRSPAKVRYLDEDIIVIVNKLTWVPLMLLVMPKKHMGQMEMWCSDLMPRLGDVAMEMGCTFAPSGFRVLSNFGHDGMQSQSHSHLHVIGGIHLGPYA